MWKRLQSILRCPLCASGLSLVALVEHDVVFAESLVEHARECGLFDAGFGRYIDAGVLSCSGCGVSYPIFQGLPVLLPYATSIHKEFKQRYASELDTSLGRLRFPDCDPVPGERLVLQSFSTEWLAYDFDGVIWEMGYGDHEERFLRELGELGPRQPCGRFLELGCGIGVTTELAQRNFGVDAVGVDLSLAALRATEQNRHNPFVHFVQGSVFNLPFAKRSFDTIYTRGVLHHTYSTAKAFRALAEQCKPGGAMYVWVYGPRSIGDNALRSSLFAIERVVRRLLRGRDSGVLAAIVLPPLACAYMIFNWSRRFKDPTIQPYNFRRAMHAARDRFTPEFAHRHDDGEVRAWFASCGFADIEVVDWRVMPSADHDDYRRNTGVRGRMVGDSNVLCQHALATAPTAATPEGNLH